MSKILNIYTRYRNYFTHSYFGTSWYEASGDSSFSGLPYSYGSNAGEHGTWLSKDGGTTVHVRAIDGSASYNLYGSLQPSYGWKNVVGEQEVAFSGPSWDSDNYGTNAIWEHLFYFAYYTPADGWGTLRLRCQHEDVRGTTSVYDKYFSGTSQDIATTFKVSKAVSPGTLTSVEGCSFKWIADWNPAGVVGESYELGRGTSWIFDNGTGYGTMYGGQGGTGYGIAGAGTHIHEFFYQGSSDTPGGVGTWHSWGSGTQTFIGAVGTYRKSLNWATAVQGSEFAGTMGYDFTILNLPSPNNESDWTGSQYSGYGWEQKIVLEMIWQMDAHAGQAWATCWLGELDGVEYIYDAFMPGTLGTVVSNVDIIANQGGTVGTGGNSWNSPFTATFTFATTYTWETQKHLEAPGSYIYEGLVSRYTSSAGTKGEGYLSCYVTYSPIKYRPIGLLGADEGSVGTQFLAGTDKPYQFAIHGSYLPIDIPNSYSDPWPTGSAAGNFMFDGC